VDTNAGPHFGDDPGQLPDKRSYVLPRHRIVFVSVAKSACTSVKWMLARLSDQDEQRFLSHPGMKVDPAFTIHRRGLWEDVPTLGSLPPDQLSDIHPDNGWFVFGVTRDPRTRLFSAWQSKFLLRLPTYVKAADEPFFPRVPTSVDDVIEDFAGFVRFLHDNPTHPLIHPNVHFRAQSDLLQTAHVPYSRVYDVRDLAELPKDLEAHLSRIGVEDQPVLGREHGTPLRAHQALFENGVRELIEKHYAADFAEFGDRWDFDHISAEPPRWSPEVFQAIRTTLAAYEQIKRISEDQRRLQGELATATAERDAEIELLRKKLRRARRKVSTEL
jgi:hypothetical protein